MNNLLALPSSEKAWLNSIKNQGLGVGSIHEEKHFSSASKFEAKHFLLLRVLWKQTHIKDFKPEKFGLQEWLKTAQTMLAGYDSWQKYLGSFDGQYNEGNFFLAKVHQEEAWHVASEMSDSILLSPPRRKTRSHDHPELGTPSKSKASEIELDDLFRELDIPVTPETRLGASPFGSIGSWADRSWGPRHLWKEMYPKARDEQIVNTALLNFLKALTSHFRSLSSDWTLEQNVLEAKFDSGSYIAKTDGHLKGKAGGDVRGLVEVKTCLRALRLDDICRQESAQMVAWLKENPETPGQPFRRFHVSQDRHEIWLILAEYDERYLNYLKGDYNETEARSFLTMHEIGPWDTQSKEAMKHLGPILLALALRSDQDRVDEQSGHADKPRKEK
ncbi:hypothetical protein BO78DRAFT_407843 [Aspergillus sclerotiicarbonarius CBS 121057]|uniref:Uncharacterized protein n=1 Tax=Aspergillus sclerotiicarbonarius (strain CBS 121057 / IBT 28362) TaxID=1448318 RepID=A0A319E722_ASPSB|nr:hypothetical protein BO78DRAFT_407843 [Aspergillus sclerotiicarbonarius CBS 121057]